MFRVMKPFAAVTLAFGLLALTTAPNLLAGSKDAESKKWTEKLKNAKDAKTKAEAIAQIGKLALINSKLGEAALPDIKTALKDKDVTVRREAALAYGRCDPDESGAAKILAELLKDDDNEVKTNAALGLTAMGKNATDAVPDLKAAIKPVADKKKEAAQDKQNKIYRDAIQAITATKRKN